MGNFNLEGIGVNPMQSLDEQSGLNFGDMTYDPSAFSFGSTSGAGTGLNLNLDGMELFGNEFQTDLPTQLGNLDFGTQVAEPGFMDSFLGSTNENGVFQPGYGLYGLKALTGVANTYLGMKQYGLAKKQFKENKRQFNLQYDAQKNLTNSQLADRQRSRVAGSAGQLSVDEYMGQYGIK